MSEGIARFCPQCGSATVNYSALANGAAECTGCRWRGAENELLSVPFSHDFISDNGMMTQLMNDLRNILSGELGLPYLKFLIKWGFVKADVARLAETLDRKLFARYMVAIARAVLTAILEERSRQATEAAQKRMQETEGAN